MKKVWLLAIAMVAFGCSDDDPQVTPLEDGGAGDAPLVCAPLTTCHDGCVDTQSDRNNCGACDTACAAGEICENGACVISCGGSTPTACGDACVDTQTNRAHCGACGNACAAGQVCSMGACAATCGGDTATQCGDGCVDTQTNRAHCGACDNACEAGQVCSMGVCELSCGGDTPTQCENACVNTITDSRNCGACGNACGIGEECDMGACVADCDIATPNRCNGVCTDIQADDLNCGACGNACGAGQACDMGACVCLPAAPDLCGDTCVDMQSDVMNCGSCGNVCGDGLFCIEGACLDAHPQCAMAYTTFSSAERNVSQNGGVTYCDRVGRGGDWTGDGWYRFDGSAGTKMPESAPPKNRCGTHAPGWLNGAHPSQAEGIVERQVCYHWSNNTCLWSNDINVLNCGAFYLYELVQPPGCQLRYCGEGCAGGETLCDFSCVDTNMDAANCGACGNACGMGEVCLGGACAAPVL